MNKNQLKDLPVNRDLLLYSFPKCGRTWLRYLFAHLFHQHLAAEHEVMSDWGEKLILILMRDIRDVLVSYFFEVTNRPAGFGQIGPARDILTERWDDSEKTISHFLRIGTIPVFLDFYQQCMQLNGNKYIITYEKLHKDPIVCLRSFYDYIVEFIQVPEVPKGRLEIAVEKCNFNNMHKTEEHGEGLQGVYRDGTWLPNLTAGDRLNPKSFKTREGKVGSYINYLSPSDIEYVKKEAERHPIFPLISSMILRSD